jgi:hypothetical protein
MLCESTSLAPNSASNMDSRTRMLNESLLSAGIPKRLLRMIMLARSMMI